MVLYKSCSLKKLQNYTTMSKNELKRVTVVLKKMDVAYHKMRLEVLNNIRSQTSDCFVVNELEDGVVLGDTAIRELARELDSQSDIVIIDFSTINEDDIRRKIFKAFPSESLKKIVVFLISDFADNTIDSPTRERMIGALQTIFSGVDIVLYKSKEDFKKAIMSLFEGKKINEDVPVVTF